MHSHEMDTVGIERTHPHSMYAEIDRQNNRMMCRNLVGLERSIHKLVEGPHYIRGRRPDNTGDRCTVVARHAEHRRCTVVATPAAAAIPAAVAAAAPHAGRTPWT